MKKILIITVVAAIALMQLVMLTGCGGDDNPANPMEANQRHFGEVVSVDGNRVTMNVLSFAGGFDDSQVSENGERVMVRRDGDEVEVIGDVEDCDDEECLCELEYIIWEREDGENGDFAARGRIAGADAEEDRIRTGGEGGQQLMVTGDMPPLTRAGHAMSVVVPRSISVTVGLQGDETVDVSTLQQGDVVLVIFDEEGRMDSIRFLPDATIE